MLTRRKPQQNSKGFFSNSPTNIYFTTFLQNESANESGLESWCGNDLVVIISHRSIGDHALEFTIILFGTKVHSAALRVTL